MEYFLVTKRCGFSVWNKEDLSKAKILWGEPEVTKYICANGVFSIQDIEKRLNIEINNYEQYLVQYFPFFELQTGNLIGCCGLRPYKNKSGVYELGFHLRKEYWNQGYAYEAAKCMIEYAFSELHALELKAGHHPKNIASAKLLAKLGFQYEFDEFYEPTGLNHPMYRLLK